MEYLAYRVREIYAIPKAFISLSSNIYIYGTANINGTVVG